MESKSKSQSISHSKPKIGVFCESEISDEEVLSALLSTGEFDPVCFDSADELIEDYQKGQTKGIVFGLERIHKHQVEIMSKIVDSVHGTPVTILSNSMSEQQRLEISGLGNIFALKNPSELGSISGVFQKMFEAQPVISRLDERHRVSLLVDFKRDTEKGSCLLTDISHSGASGVIESGDLQAGDFVRIHVPVLNYLKDKWIAAQVIWERPVHSYEGTQTKIGFSFAV